VDLDPSPNTLTIDVNAANDEPAGTDFGFTDPVEGDSLLAIQMPTLPAVGLTPEEPEPEDTSEDEVIESGSNATPSTEAVSESAAPPADASGNGAPSPVTPTQSQPLERIQNNSDRQAGPGSPDPKGFLRASLVQLITQALLWDLPGGAPTDEGSISTDPRGLTKLAGFVDGLDKLRDDVREDLHSENVKVGSAIAATSGLSVGYVIWLIRSGALLSSFLSSMPAWQLIDPLPVLAYRRNNDDDDDESLESIIERHSTRTEKANVDGS
jgi:hypothetical protein